MSDEQEERPALDPNMKVQDLTLGQFFNLLNAVVERSMNESVAAMRRAQETQAKLGKVIGMKPKSAQRYARRHP
jgi:hypothetical protein